MARKGTAQAFRLLERAGFHLTRVGAWDPVPDTRVLGDVAGRRRELVGVDMRDAAQQMILNDLMAYKAEYDRIDEWYDLDNPMYGRIDAEVYYAMIRRLRPRTIVEIGSGNSTRIAVNAVKANGEGRVICMDPQPRADITDLPITWLKSRVEDVALANFSDLRDGDILFIDSSHVLRTGGDVQQEYLEILPRLKAGVVVHIHDIFLPVEYPGDWLLNMRMFPTEQYMLQAFLAFNSAFEVLWGSQHMHLFHPDLLAAGFASYRRDLSPGSFWIRRVR
jgi:hypothetical protein